MRIVSFRFQSWVNKECFHFSEFLFHLLVREPYKFSKKTANLNLLPARIIESFLLFTMDSSQTCYRLPQEYLTRNQATSISEFNFDLPSFTPIKLDEHPSP
ncbi:MAG: hypothetical protein EBT88_14725 [Proteobacteria bacterium]|nr:hypothetical protein [Pseudomonadota bacterium]